MNERINYFASLFATEILARRKSSSDEMAVDGDAEELPTETGKSDEALTRATMPSLREFANYKSATTNQTLNHTKNLQSLSHT